MDPRFEQVTQALEDYFDGLYESDTSRLRRIFHPGAIYACATETPFRYLTMEDYFRVVDQRPSPAGRGERRRDQVLAIEFAGADTAIVKATCAIGERFFTDFLSMVRLDGRWLIISKVFHFELADSA